jgi:hypothetical protein
MLPARATCRAAHPSRLRNEIQLVLREARLAQRFEAPCQRGQTSSARVKKTASSINSQVLNLAVRRSIAGCSPPRARG